mmetsp:Transcript_71615/g.158220  ORF Transcript_71615/g.158220 Transcript_71615/m.158220 type:complete len:232 (-) Transcript_71615:84-779(-)
MLAFLWSKPTVSDPSSGPSGGLSATKTPNLPRLSTRPRSSPEFLKGSIAAATLRGRGASACMVRVSFCFSRSRFRIRTLTSDPTSSCAPFWYTTPTALAPRATPGWFGGATATKRPKGRWATTKPRSQVSASNCWSSCKASGSEGLKTFSESLDRRTWLRRRFSSFFTCDTQTSTSSPMATSALELPGAILEFGKTPSFSTPTSTSTKLLVTWDTTPGTFSPTCSSLMRRR